jgi:1-deoxy-D-xylulose-5-phosphate reductoisomerase
MCLSRAAAVDNGAMHARLAVLGATGSIGRQAIEVAAAHPDRLRITGLSCRTSAAACEALAGGDGARVVVAERDGEDAVIDLARADDVDMVIIGIPGIAALRPTLAALDAGKAVAIAAKEVLVVAGHLVRARVPRGAGERLRPIDSEHCALWQCLRGEDRAAVTSVTLTASGGPFRDTPLGELRIVDADHALRHPTWHMGPKVTIDSATLVNKAYEIIEAHWLFDLPYASIDAVIHPQSLVHALVRFADGSVKAQLADPDMRLPIQYALLYPARVSSPARELRLHELTFAAIEPARYPCFGLVLEAARLGPAATIAVNAADEIAVARFLAGELSFTGIADVLERALAIAQRAALPAEPDLETIVAFDHDVRRELSTQPAVA